MSQTGLAQRLLKKRKFRKLLIALLFVALILGLIIVPVEKSWGNHRFNSYFDGVYWAVTTITTVGYGDYVPLSPIGKAVAILLQLVGAMMFGLVIAMISSYVNRTQEEFYWNRLFERLNRLEKEIEGVQKKSDFIVKTEEESQHV